MTIPRPDKLPEWASVPQSDPNEPVPNIVEPPAGKKQLGWIFKEFPPSNWFNWILNKAYKWLEYFDDQHINVAPIFGIDTSITPDQVVVTLVPAIDSYVEGRLFLIKIANTNTGATTIDINGEGAEPILDLDGSVLVGGELVENIIYMFVYSEGAAPGQEHFILQSKPDVVSGMTTGDWKFTIKTAPDSGYILYNGDGTIGSATSGASILASTIAEKLFKSIWNNCLNPECPVDGTRGASADIDWILNKRIHVPAIYNKVFASRTGQAMAASEGEVSHILSTSELSIHSHNYENKDALTNSTGGGNVNIWQLWRQIATSFTGNSDAHNNMQPTIYFSIMMKL